MSFPTFLYTEGSDHVRPFIIIPLEPVPSGWPHDKPQIAYYRTSGQSNDGHDIFKDTWLPTFGYGRPNPDPDSTVENEKILKLSDAPKIGNPTTNPTTNVFQPGQRQIPPPTKVTLDTENLVKDFLIWCYSDNFDSANTDTFVMDEFVARTKSTQFYNGRSIISFDASKAVDFGIIQKFLGDYFITEWQVRISLAIGGGIWDSEIFDFKLFKLYLEQKSISSPPIPNILSTKHISLPESVSEEAIENFKRRLDTTPGVNQGNAVDLIKFLKDNGAQLNVGDIQAIVRDNNIYGSVKYIWMEPAVSESRTALRSRLRDYSTRHPDLDASVPIPDTSVPVPDALIPVAIKRKISSEVEVPVVGTRRSSRLNKNTGGNKKTNKKRNKKRNKKTNKKRNKKTNKKRKQK